MGLRSIEAGLVGAAQVGQVRPLDEGFSFDALGGQPGMDTDMMEAPGQLDPPKACFGGGPPPGSSRQAPSPHTCLSAGSTSLANRSHCRTQYLRPLWVLPWADLCTSSSSLDTACTTPFGTRSCQTLMLVGMGRCTDLEVQANTSREGPFHISALVLGRLGKSAT